MSSIVLVMCGIGCRKEVDESVFQNAQTAFDDAETKFAKGEFEQALSGYETAISQGGLNADLHCMAQLRRAEALARLARFDEAHAILDGLEQGAPELARVHITRCFLFEKQGKPQEAAEQYRLARQHDPQIKKLAP